MIYLVINRLEQGFLKVGDFRKLEGENLLGAKRGRGRKFKTFVDELILDILELQMMRKKSLRRIFR